MSVDGPQALKQIYRKTSNIIRTSLP